MYVRYDGLVHPCCYMYKEPPVGDLKKQSVMEVWDSEAMVKLREAHVSGDLSAYPACQTCQAARPRPIAFYGSLLLNSLTVRKAVPAMEKLARFYARNGRHAAVEDWGELVAGDPLHRKMVTGYHTPDAR